MVEMAIPARPWREDRQACSVHIKWLRDIGLPVRRIDGEPETEIRPLPLEEIKKNATRAGELIDKLIKKINAILGEGVDHT